MNIFVTRHGERWDFLDRSWRDTAEFKGDPGLSKRGKQQSELLGKYLGKENFNFDIILCSPYTRCIETILPYLKISGKKINIEYGLMELLYYPDSEDYEPRSLEYLKKEYRKFINMSYETEISMNEIPKSEIIHEFRERMEKLLEILTQKEDYKNKSILLVSHAAAVVSINEIVTSQKTEKKNTDISAGVCSLSQYYLANFGDGVNGLKRILNGKNDFLEEFSRNPFHWDFSNYKGKWKREEEKTKR